MNVVDQTQAGYFAEDRCDPSEFIPLVSQTLPKAAAPHAATIANNIPLYDAGALRPALLLEETRRSVMAEWAEVLRHSAGALVIKQAYPDTEIIDAATTIYNEIIDSERKRAGGGGDHFAKAGSNDRIWNSLQKLCEASPTVFATYFANPVIAAICEAWLGPGYQMTAQVNLVHPGGAAQEAHRDFHLGFQTAAISALYPAHVHDLSPVMTLQGAIAHCDMPIESGPTKLLPFSQLYRPGYAAWRRADFRNYFEAHHVQLPLQKGDALFFNPALFHAAGANVSANIQRMANLLQISSAFGRAMESVDRLAMSQRLYPVLRRMKSEGALTREEIAAAIAACAEGYSFPTNLDRDPPVGGLAPETQQALMLRALDADMPQEQINTALADQAARQRA